MAAFFVGVRYRPVFVAGSWWIIELEPVLGGMIRKNKHQMRSRAIHAIASGDRHHLAAIYRSSFPGVASFVRQQRGSLADASDVFQEAITILYLKSRTGDLVLTCSPETYLHAIARNVWHNQRRHSTARPDLNLRLSRVEEAVAPATCPLAYLESADRRMLFQRYFDALPADCRQLFGMVFDGEKMATIAGKMGYKSAGYAKKKHCKCKARLIAAIRKDPKFEELK